MYSRKLLTNLIGIVWLFFSFQVQAQTKGISFQGTIRDPSNRWVNATGVTIRARILAPNGCILRDESFPTQDIVSGYVSLNLGNGTVGGADPSLSFVNLFNNSLGVLSGLTCINSDGTLNGSISSYSPTVNDPRKLHVSLTLGSDNINAQFNMRSMAFAVSAETLNGKTETDFVRINSGSGVTQANVESVFNRYTKLDSILSTFNTSGTTYSGNAATATTATTATSATNVTGTVAVANGGTGATTASGARTNLGLGSLATVTPTGTASVSTYLRGDGAWSTFASDITSLDASVITSGTIASARLPASASYWSSATGGINYASGNVGVGNSTPSAALDVVGQTRSVSTGGASKINASAAVNWNDGNAQGMSVPCTSTAFTNMLDGGTYILAVSDTTATTCVFSQAGLTFLYNPANAARTSGQQTVYTFQRIGSNVYVSWIAGFQ